MAEGGASPSFIQIPGNVKSMLAPFVIRPDARINQKTRNSSELAGTVASPQLFTYKNIGTTMEGGTAKLQFYPSSLDYQAFLADDISLKLLYSRNNGIFPKDAKSPITSITMQDILNSIPGVQIREFLPDTRLDQCINLFTDMISNMTKLFSGEKDSSQGTSGEAQQTKNKDDVWIGKRLMAAAWYTMKYMVGATNPDFFDDLSFGTAVKDLPFSSYDPTVYQNNVEYPGSYVMSFPYTLYYRLQSCMTTNIYEIPASQTSKAILNSGGGMAGWTDSGSDIMSSGELRMSGLLGKIPVIGSIANMILGNIGINYMPWWNAESGAKTKEPEVELKFDLFNDNANSARQNFLFVNTIVPHNKWIQYNMFQHSSSLYDVKIEGINRLFACAGDINVAYEGVLRDPPQSWIDNLVDTHGNNCMNKAKFKENIKNNKLIKIPDVYRVTMKFQSLLPANFNNYIFNYAENASHITKYNDKTYDQSAVSQILPKALATYAKRVANVWNAGDESVENKPSK